MKTRILLAAAVAALLAAGCATTPKKDYSSFIASDPRSLLIVPVVNKSVDVNAPDYFLSTLPIMPAERGYYVFPVNLVKRLLEDEGMSDAAMVHSADPSRLANMFGADAVLYATIERWDAKYLVLSTQVTVEFTYVIREGRTGQELWRDHQVMVYSPQQSSSGGHPLAQLIAMAVSAAVTKAAPNYMPLAYQANAQAFAWPGRGFPSGPHHPEYRKDLPQDTGKKAPAAGTDNAAPAPAAGKAAPAPAGK